MLPAENRVQCSEDFRRAFRTGSKSGSRLLVLHAAVSASAASRVDTDQHSAAAGTADADESHAARVGFVVSKAVGNAVVRNRVKRRLRDIARHRLGGLPAGLYVLRALPAAANASYTELAATVDRLLVSAERKAQRASGGDQRAAGRAAADRGTSAAPAGAETDGGG